MSKLPTWPSIDHKIIGRVHYEELGQFLINDLSKETNGWRGRAREKLTRLSQYQFQELSTDVYDDLLRRKNNIQWNEAVPHLPYQEGLHRKRNQARQKMSTLPIHRFKDLCSDVYFELGRRYPQFKTEMIAPTHSRL